ncbi:MAG: hypothetical protein ACLRMU_01765 [Ruminococcus sp.]
MKQPYSIYQSAQLHLQDFEQQSYEQPVAAQVIADCFPFAKTRSQAIMKTTLVRIVVPKFD